jgi:hypothetical protein
MNSKKISTNMEMKTRKLYLKREINEIKKAGNTKCEIEA